MSIKTSPLSSGTLFARHGINRSLLYRELYSSEKLYIHEISALSLYKRVDMPGKCFRDYLRNGMFYFYNPVSGEHQLFNIVYHACGPVSIREHEITISLRVAKPDFNIEPIAFVTISKRNN